MANKLNVNLVLCQRYDDKTKTISNVFNEITTNDKHEATFSVITFMNEIISDDNVADEEFVLHYFLVETREDEAGRRRGLYLGATDFYRNPQEGYKNRNCLSNNDNTFSDLTFENVSFIGEGKYRIEAFKVDGVLDENEDYEQLREKSNEFRRIGEYVSFTSFTVKYPK